MSTRSPSGTSSPTTGSTLFGTGVLSPVRPASSISSVATTSTRPSAGTLSPASKPTMSPGTSSSAGTSCTCPSRLTLAVMISICFRAATLSAALPSWCRPINALKTVKATSTQAVDQSWMPITRHDGRAQEHQLHQVLVLPKERLPRRFLGFVGKLVRPVLLAARLDLRGAQADCRIDVELSTALVDRHRVPRPLCLRGLRCCWCHLCSRSPTTRSSEFVGRAIDPGLQDEDRPRPGGRAPPDDGWDRSPTVATSSESASVHRRFTRRFRSRRVSIGDPPATTLTGVGPHHPARPYVDGARSRSSNGRPGHGGGRKGMRCTTCAIAASSRRSTSSRRSCGSCCSSPRRSRSPSTRAPRASVSTGKDIALIFEKTSTRTRSAFEVAAFDQGAHVTYLDPSGSQLGHKESVADTARVLGRMYDAIEFRGNASRTSRTSPPTPACRCTTA